MNNFLTNKQSSALFRKISKNMISTLKKDGKTDKEISILFNDALNASISLSAERCK